ncbi:inositol monophosphatase family protein [Tepidibacillus marianensis]|uniref:inositol monophosphatase family protein n=1 Tax=Tepidibacillus marianensis TaxID=3131995 RepID=UPI0030CA98F8
MLDSVKEIALMGGKYLKDHYLKAIRVDLKGKKDLVTEVDYASEKLVIAEIEKRFPDHSILSEEIGLIDKGSDYKWVLDPLDGTVNFARGIPLFGIILSLLYKEEPIIGVVYLPVLNELYYAEKSKGAFLNDEPIHVTETNELADAIISLGDFNIGLDDQTKNRVNDRLINIISQFSPRTMRTKGFGSAAVDLTFLASGRTDALFYGYSNPWDILAGELILKEAGGNVSQIDDLQLFSNKNLHDTILIRLK